MAPNYSDSVCPSLIGPREGQPRAKPKSMLLLVGISLFDRALLNSFLWFTIVKFLNADIDVVLRRKTPPDLSGAFIIFTMFNEREMRIWGASLGLVHNYNANRRCTQRQT